MDLARRQAVRRGPEAASLGVVFLLGVVFRRCDTPIEIGNRLFQHRAMRGRRRALQIRLGPRSCEGEGRSLRPACRVLSIDRWSHPPPILRRLLLRLDRLALEAPGHRQAAMFLPESEAFFVRPVRRRHPTYRSDAVASHRRRRMYHGFL